MSGLTFRIGAPPNERLDLSQLTPARLAEIPVGDVPRLVIGTSKRGLTVGDVFKVSGSTGHRSVLEGGSGPPASVCAAPDHAPSTVTGRVGMRARR